MPSSSPHVFVADVDDERPELAAADRHHLERVLRLRPGDELTVTDGRGRWRPCRFAAQGRLEVAGDVVVVPAPSPPIAVAFALTKGEKPELTVQKLTELGADRIIPFAADRSVVRWSADAAGKHVERLRRVAREAACQSHRAWLPEVDDLTTFAALATQPGAALADLDGDPPSLAPLVLVGPEGGWSDGERAHGLPRFRLGPHVLRAETASIAVGALLAALRENLVAPS